MFEASLLDVVTLTTYVGDSDFILMLYVPCSKFILKTALTNVNKRVYGVYISNLIVYANLKRLVN